MHKDFKAARREATAEPITFTITGRDGSVSKPFTLEDDLAAMPLLDLAVMADQQDRDEANELETVLAFRNFLRSILVPQDVDRFERTVRDKRLAFPDLLPIVQWAVSELAGRPTKRPSDSPERPQITGLTSRDSFSEVDIDPALSFT